jgi:hypothetical protein
MSEHEIDLEARVRKLEAEVYLLKRLLQWETFKAGGRNYVAIEMEESVVQSALDADFLPDAAPVDAIREFVVGD